MIGKILSEYKWPILGIGLALGVGYGAYHLVDKVENLSGEVSVTQEKIKTLTTALDTVKKESEDREGRMNLYFAKTNKGQEDLDKKVAQLDKALKRENIVAAKPGLVTKMAKKSNKEYEERLACLTGNMEYCEKTK